MAPTDLRSISKPKVLLVDDERALLEVQRLGLEAEYEVEVAATAEEAGLLLSTGRHDVVICDHLMPGETGLDFLVSAFRRQPESKRILVTGYLNPEFLARSTRVAGLSACLLKPVPLSELKAAIRTALVDAI
jgi:DNA-binding NtrC family response regulator